MLIKSATADSRHKLLRKWIRGAALNQTDLGDPTGSAEYALFMYVGPTNAPIASAALPPGIELEAHRRHGPQVQGRQPRRMSLALLRAAPRGKSKALVEGEGAALRDPTLPLSYPVTVQLKKNGSSLCLASTFTSTDEKKNTATQFQGQAVGLPHQHRVC